MYHSFDKYFVKHFRGLRNGMLFSFGGGKRERLNTGMFQELEIFLHHKTQHFFSGIKAHRNVKSLFVIKTNVFLIIFVNMK